jgi:hypothetical protein
VKSLNLDINCRSPPPAPWYKGHDQQILFTFQPLIKYFLCYVASSWFHSFVPSVLFSRNSLAMHFTTVDVLISAFLFINSVHASPLHSRQNDVTACLDSHNVTYSIAGSSDWTALITPYNLRLAYVPAVVTIPTTPEDVSWSVQCAAASSLKVQAKGGGHSYASYSSGGQNGSLIIEMENFNSITVNPGKSFANMKSLNTDRPQILSLQRLDQGNVLEMLQLLSSIRAVVLFPTAPVLGLASQVMLSTAVMDMLLENGA